MTNQQPVSLDVQLYLWWDGLPPGTGVTMQEMLVNLGVNEPQAIRNSLTRIRKGRVRDPSADGYLAPKPVRYDSASRSYYDLSKTTPDVVAAQVPGNILAQQITQLLTRAFTLNEALNGLALAADQYLEYPEIRALIGQLPLETMRLASTTVQELAWARNLLAIEEVKREQLPPGNQN